jgi:hypothetical protein
VRPNADPTAGRFLRPTQPTASDPFGTRLEPVRRTDAPTTLTVIDGDPSYALLEGFDGTLDGFSVFEESDPPQNDRGKILAALGVENATSVGDSDELPAPLRPAVAATGIGKGVMIRVGLPEWSQRLDDRQVAQITLNIADILRRLPAKIHTPPR